jgi:hypothetical protein
MVNRLIKYFKHKSLQINRINTNVNHILQYLENDLKSHKVNLGQIQARLNNDRQSISSIHEVEFQVFSQWGDDGIIQYLINKLEIPNKIFIEFGVENYKESNTRFLLINNNWSGLVIDGSSENVEYIKRDTISWAFDIHATHAFITKENINNLISTFLNKGYPSEIGIMSIDIDGNDYWIWQEIKVVNPIIIIVEYNSVFGDSNLWTIPYKSDFYRLDYHSSYQYWGASLGAYCALASSLGYHFIGCNSNGNNAYFVRKDKIGDFKPLSCKDGFVQSKYRDHVDENGERWGGEKRINLIRGMPIFDIDTNRVIEI